MAKDKRGGPNIDALVTRAARAAGVPPDLYRRLILKGERSWKGWQHSPVGAAGPAQLMPGTAASLSRKYKINTNDFYGNLLGGAYYLKEQLQRFGDPKLAVAAYNAGPGAVAKYGGVPPYAETQRYVANIFSGGIPDMTGGGAISESPAGMVPASGGTPSPGKPNPLAIIDWTRPSANSVSILERLGGTAARVAQGAQQPLYDPSSEPTQQAPAPTMPNAPAQAAPQGKGATGVNPKFQTALQALIAEVQRRGGNLSISSGFRSVAEQQQLWNAALKKYGSAAAARKWVAPPGSSRHNMGVAADLRGSLDLAHQLAPKYGLYFPMSWENWHVELRGSR